MGSIASEVAANAGPERIVVDVTEAVVRELWMNTDDVVLGVGYQRPDGSLEYLACDVLILSCNGFGGNAPMVSELLPAIGQLLEELAPCLS